MTGSYPEDVRFVHILWRIAAACSVLLLLAPLTPRTTWTYVAQSESRGDVGTVTHSAGREWVALLCGIIAIAALVAMKRRFAGGIVAMLAFAAAAAAALGHWLQFQSGSLVTLRSIVHPAPAAPYFAAIAVAGLTTTVAWLWCWVQHRHGHSRFA